MAVLFFYGTLMDGDLLRLVTGQKIDVRPAWLENHRRVPVVGCDYPMLIPQAGSRVVGRLALSIDAAALSRLCRYEGRQYRLTTHNVATQDGASHAAQIFTPLPNVRGDSSRDWDFAKWRMKSKRKTISRMLAG